MTKNTRQILAILAIAVIAATIIVESVNRYHGINRYFWEAPSKDEVWIP